MIAVIGAVAAVLVARVSVPRPQPAGHPEPEDGPPALEVSPEIWMHFSGRIRGLEDKVDHLTDLVEAQTVRVGSLEKLLRMAMRVIRRANRRLRAAELEPEPIPAELVPYSIE
ncbi:hypothetical protein [Streptomyces sp. NPDC058674]|uniref:hypothetical protein n=1 Tax=Streptomyces sp. NPDC058674 TaxID=3346592 RepID=UPI003646D855